MAERRPARPRTSSPSASSPRASASTVACRGAKLAPAARSARSAALIAWLARSASIASSAPTLRQGEGSAATMQATEQRAADEIVARWREPAAESEQRARGTPHRFVIVGAIRRGERAYARDREIERERRRRAREQRAEAARLAERRDPCSEAPRRLDDRARRLRQAAATMPRAAMRRIARSSPRATGAAVTTARGCMAGSREPTQTISPAAS